MFSCSIQQICADSEIDDDESKITTKDDQKNGPRPLEIFAPFEHPTKILSLAFYKNTLMIGTTAQIIGYEWIKSQINKKLWAIQIPTTKQGGGVDQKYEINSLFMLDNRVCIGCGDSNVYLVNLDNGEIERQFEGHTDYIHDVYALDTNQIYSASEDGTVRFWDSRKKRSTGKLEPFKNNKLARPQFGIWQGSVAVNNDWLLCGGGPSPSLWHLRSMECTTIYPFIEKVHVTGFIDDIVYIAGDLNSFSQFNLNGELTANLPTSGSSIYSVVTQQSPNKLISIGGTSNSLDLCTNWNYKDSVLKLY